MVRWLVVPLLRQWLSLILTTWTTGLIREAPGIKSATNQISAKNSSRLCLPLAMSSMMQGTLSFKILRMNVRGPLNLMSCVLRNSTGLMRNLYQKWTQKKLSKGCRKKNTERKSRLTIRKPLSTSKMYRVN